MAASRNATSYRSVGDHAADSGGASVTESSRSVADYERALVPRTDADARRPDTSRSSTEQTPGENSRTAVR
ncbi:hypothetical protein [Nocardia gipuzkoensis]|uniref:hypothetical protein n=1 Tax=Nocardia gipuzkoensis TaxID=2749991 RepID=UPI003EE2EDA5